MAGFPVPIYPLKLLLRPSTFVIAFLQVKAVFDTIAPAVGLSVGLAVGQTSIVAEAAELVQIRKSMVHSFGKFEAATPDLAENQDDILVATPGRLMDHIRNTKGFTLQHLQFLVSFFRGERGNRGTALPRLMKMVLSATLTRDPAKIAQLGLLCPIYVAPGAAGNRYQLPEQLKSYRMVRISVHTRCHHNLLLTQFSSRSLGACVCSNLHRMIRNRNCCPEHLCRSANRERSPYIW